MCSKKDQMLTMLVCYVNTSYTYTSKIHSLLKHNRKKLIHKRKMFTFIKLIF